MASIRLEITVKASPEAAWDAMRDIGALHHRLVPGFVVDTKLEPGARVVTFANGMSVKEVIVDVDDAARRLVWSARSEALSHHNASAQIFANAAGGSTVVWICDLLPDEMRGPIEGMMQAGMAAMQHTLDALG